MVRASRESTYNIVRSYRAPGGAWQFTSQIMRCLLSQRSVSAVRNWLNTVMFFLQLVTDCMGCSSGASCDRSMCQAPSFPLPSHRRVRERRWLLNWLEVLTVSPVKQDATVQIIAGRFLVFGCLSFRKIVEQSVRRKEKSEISRLAAGDVSFLFLAGLMHT